MNKSVTPLLLFIYNWPSAAMLLRHGVRRGGVGVAQPHAVPLSVSYGRSWTQSSASTSMSTGASSINPAKNACEADLAAMHRALREIVAGFPPLDTLVPEVGSTREKLSAVDWGRVGRLGSCGGVKGQGLLKRFEDLLHERDARGAGGAQRHERWVALNSLEVEALVDREQVVITNTGRSDVDLSLCTLSDYRYRHLLTFPKGTAVRGNGGTITVYTAPGNTKYLGSDALRKILLRDEGSEGVVLWRNADGSPRAKEVLNDEYERITLAPPPVELEWRAERERWEKSRAQVSDVEARRVKTEKQLEEARALIKETELTLAAERERASEMERNYEAKVQSLTEEHRVLEAGKVELAKEISEREAVQREMDKERWEKSRAHVFDVEARRVETEKQLEIARARVKDLQQEVQDLSQDLSEARDAELKLVAERERVSALEKEWDAKMKGLMEEHRILVEAGKAELANEIGKREAVQKEMVGAQARVALLQQEVQGLSLKLSELRDASVLQLAEEQERSSELLRKSDAKMQSLIQEHEVELANEISKRESLRKEMEGARARVASLQQEVTNVSQMSGDIESFKAEAASQLAAEKQRADELLKKKDAATQRLTQEYSDRLKVREAELAGEVSKREALQKETEAARARFRELKEERDRQARLVSETLAKYESLSASIAETKSDTDAGLEKMNAMYERQMEEQRGLLAAKEKEISMRQKVQEDLSTKVNALEADVEREKKHAMEVTAENKLMSESHAMRERNWKIQVSQLKNQVHQLKKLEESDQGNASHTAELHKRAEELKGERDDLRSRLSEATQRLELLEAGSAGESPDVRAAMLSAEREKDEQIEKLKLIIADLEGEREDMKERFSTQTESTKAWVERLEAELRDLKEGSTSERGDETPAVALAHWRAARAEHAARYWPDMLAAGGGFALFTGLLPLFGRHWGLW